MSSGARSFPAQSSLGPKYVVPYLPSLRANRANCNSLNGLRVSWITKTNNSKEGFSWIFVGWSLDLTLVFLISEVTPGSIPVMHGARKDHNE